MPWNFWKRQGAGPDDPAVLVNENGDLLTDAEGKPITVRADNPEAAENQRLREENQRLRDERRQEITARISQDAASFADGLIARGKALPAERDRMMVAYAQAILDDQGIDARAYTIDTSTAAGSSARLAIAHPGEPAYARPARAGALQAAYDARSQHGLFEPRLSGETRRVAAHAPTPEFGARDEDPDQIKQQDEETRAFARGYRVNGRSA
jgi:hypothetical protein